MRERGAPEARAEAEAVRRARRGPGDREACVVAIVLMALCAWLGMAIATAGRAETTAEAPAAAGAMAHDSLTPTYTYDGEVIRWYVLQDPDYGIEYLVNDRGGYYPKLDPYGNVVRVSYE